MAGVWRNSRAQEPLVNGMSRALEPDEIIQILGLEPHPEGGHYREMFRDTAGIEGRAHSTAIYFLLRAGEVSRWHRVDAAEVWHWYAGSSLELATAPVENAAVTIRELGSDLAAGQRPQWVIPAGHWQRARSLGGWTLVGCTVAPGFVFDTFEIAPSHFMPNAATA